MAKSPDSASYMNKSVDSSQILLNNDRGDRDGMKKVQISDPSNVGVLAPTEREHKFVPFSFCHDSLYHYFISSVNCPHSYSHIEAVTQPCDIMNIVHLPLKSRVKNT